MEKITIIINYYHYLIIIIIRITLLINKKRASNSDYFEPCPSANRNDMFFFIKIAVNGRH